MESKQIKYGLMKKEDFNYIYTTFKYDLNIMMSNMTEVGIMKETFSLESVEEKDGKFYIIGKALSKDFECEAGLEALADDVIKAPLVWRHRHPIQKEHKDNHIYGRVLEAWVKDFLMVKAEIYDHTKDHKALRKLIKERSNLDDPLSFSMHYRTYFNEDKTQKIHWDVFEISGTPFPACKTCQIENFIGEGNMSEVNKDKEDKEMEKIDEAVKKIKELEEQLNAKTLSLEDLQAELKKLEDETIAKDKALEEKAQESKSLEDRVLELENYTKYLEVKKPLLDEIKKVEKIDDKQFEWLKSQEKDYLLERLEDAKKNAESKVHTTNLEESAEEARLRGAELDKELEKDEPTFDEFTSQLGKNKGEK